MDTDRPSIREIRVFLEVAHVRNFSVAARRLRVSQPALSRTVGSLERHLGHPLFERGRRRLELTEQGRAFREVAMIVSSTHAAELRRYDRLCGGSTGSVTIAAVPSVTAIILPEIVSSFMRAHEGISVKMVDGSGATIMGLLLGAEVDIAITMMSADRGRLARHPLTADRFQLTCRADHALADPDVHVTWADAAAHPITSLGSDSSVRYLADATFARLGLVPHTLFEVSTIPTLGGIVAAGLGVATLPSLVLPVIGFAGLHSRVLEDPVVERELGIIYPEDRPLPKPARLFLEYLADTEERPQLPSGARWLDR